jgi:hypothetical protein
VLLINPDKFETYTIRKPSDLYSKNNRGCGPYRPPVTAIPKIMLNKITIL